MGDSGYYDDEDDEQTQDDGPRALRDALKASRKSEKTLQKQLDELQDQFGALKQSQRKQSLVELLTAKGVSQPGKAATLAEKFDVEASEESVNSWLAEYGDLLTVTKATEPGSNEDEPKPPEEDDSDEYERTTRDGFEGLSRASRGEARPSNIQDQIAKLDDPSLSYEDVIAGFRKIPGIQVGRSFD